MMGGQFRRVVLVAALLFLLAIPNVHAQCNGAIDSHGSSAYEPSHLIRPSGGVLCNLTVNFHTAAFRSVLLIDAASVPSDAAIPACDNAPIGTACVRWCLEGVTQAGGSTETTQTFPFRAGLKFNSGIVVAVSTSTSGCTTLTSDGSNDFFEWQAQ
jgi:hypothetical protein